MHSDQTFIAAFVKRGKRDRYREFLSDARLRHKFTHQLAHFRDFDPKYRVELVGSKPGIIASELRRKRSPELVVVISEDPALDQREFALTDALDRVVGRGMGAVISCIPGSLAFVETEDERFLLERHNALERREYVRFVVDFRDEDSHVEQGIFQAIWRALEWGAVTGKDAEELIKLRSWFNENLEQPSSFGRGRLSLGISWFKVEAEEHISRVYAMVRVLERNGVYIKKIKTSKPGYVVYEDEWQLVAEPFRKGTLAKR